jgi:signal transduction histidine kinase/FixJ family two-component response regulator
MGMDDSRKGPGVPPAQDPLAGGGAMSALMRRHDWSHTPLGPVDRWPQSLRSALSICLGSAFPIAIYWGGDLALLYNDAWSPIPGGKHPWALGRPAREVWPEIWDTIGPLFAHVLATGAATRSRDQLLAMRRHGFTEECYFDYTFSPIRGEGGGVAGVFNAVVETTARVIGERRLRKVRELAGRLAEAKTAEAVCRTAAETLGEAPGDVPFALLYLIAEGGHEARLAGTAGLSHGTAASPARVALTEPPGEPVGWPLARVVRAGRAELVEELEARFGPLPAGPWPESPHSALVLPVTRPGQERPYGLLVAAVSPRRPLDDDYRGFFELAAGHVGTAIANARAYEEERRRAVALSELDRAKTAFFSNVSHEFRTPLTLQLGPLEDALADAARPLPGPQRERVEIAHRNALRQLKLVNTLLDFARIEAGRVEAVYEPTDLPAYTAELASTFRSAIERAGLRLVVDCPPLAEPAYVDREMWEKVVLNLLSNALKFTFEGVIAVSVRRAGDRVELIVRDTGVGIPPEEVPRLFERFHRVQGARARTQEGSGIGLALVQELVKLHGGTVQLESRPGVGTAFTVAVPLGRAHLAANRIGAARTLESTALGAAPYVEEALRWLPGGPGAADAPGGDTRPVAGGPADPGQAWGAITGGVRILLADDNADMREYVRRLLAARWEVEAVGDGAAALAAARARVPDLVLTDVMMPGLDGFALLRALREDPRTKTVPVILLSARAGEESKVEGLEAGADDYLIKPFTARELLARVGTTLQLARLRKEVEEARRESEDRFRALVTASSDVVYRMSPDWSEMRQLRGRDFIADTDGPSRTWLEKYIHPDDQPRVMQAINEAVRTKGVFELEHRVLRVDGTLGWTFSRAIPLLNADGEIVEWLGMASDVTRRKLAEEALIEKTAHAEAARAEAQTAERRAAFLADASRVLAASLDYETTLKTAAGLAVPTLAEFCFFDLVTGEGTVRRLAWAHADSAEQARLDVLWRDAPPLPVADHPMARELATGVSGFAPDTSPAWLEAAALTQAHRAFLQDLGFRSVMTVPLGARGRVLGVLTFGFVGESSRRHTPSDLRLAEELARRAAVAVDNARLFREAQEAIRQAQAAARAREDFLARASHELRTPLTTALGTVRLLESGKADALKEPPGVLLATARRSLQAMAALINDLLDASKLASGQESLTRECVELAEAVRDGLEVVRPQAGEKGVELQVAVPAGLTVSADRLKLEQVLVNLLANAVKFTPPGGVVAVEAEAEGEAVVIRVRDSGEGIAPGQLERIFEPFYQIGGLGDSRVADRRARRVRGTGLGLAICRQVVALHGGRIWAESEGPGRGSRFTVCLPHAPADERAA